MKLFLGNFYRHLAIFSCHTDAHLPNRFSFIRNSHVWEKSVFCCCCCRQKMENASPTNLNFWRQILASSGVVTMQCSRFPDWRQRKSDPRMEKNRWEVKMSFGRPRHLTDRGQMNECPLIEMWHVLTRGQNRGSSMLCQGAL